MSFPLPSTSSTSSTSESTEDPAKRAEQARALCLRLLATRGYPDDISAQVLDRLTEVGLIDDEDFAEQWVRSRRDNAGKGKRALAAELRTKGLGNEVITAALAGIDAAAERARAEQLVRDKLRREKLGDPGDRDTENKVARRLVGMLARRGYSQSMALDIVTTELVNERERRKV